MPTEYKSLFQVERERERELTIYIRRRRRHRHWKRWFVEIAMEH